jgi:serine/threonine protein kinase
VKDMERLFIVMEVYNGGDLSQLIQEKRSKGFFSLPVCLVTVNIIIFFQCLMKIFIELLLGVRDLHKRKILHRDLKPSNILVDDNYDIKIGLGLC